LPKIGPEGGVQAAWADIEKPRPMARKIRLRFMIFSFVSQMR
jgi:hypothetical protein